MASQDINIVWDDAAMAMLPEVPSIKAVMDRMAAEAVQTMKGYCPVSPVGALHRSGTLRSSIHVLNRSGNADFAERVIGPTADYARYVNDGTVPHLIESHGNYPLRNRETGQTFGKVVHHPGTTGSHFVERTAATFEGRTEHA